MPKIWCFWFLAKVQSQARYRNLVLREEKLHLFASNFLLLHTIDNFSLKCDDRNSISDADNFVIYCWNKFVNDMIFLPLKM